MLAVVDFRLMNKYRTSKQNRSLTIQPRKVVRHYDAINATVVMGMTEIWGITELATAIRKVMRNLGILGCCKPKQGGI